MYPPLGIFKTLFLCAKLFFKFCSFHHLNWLLSTCFYKDSYNPAGSLKSMKFQNIKVEIYFRFLVNECGSQIQLQNISTVDGQSALDIEI